MQNKFNMSIINANGTMVLFFANIISKLFGAFYRLPLSNILGAEGMGLYQMAFPIYSFFLTLITGGVSITLTRQIAILRAKKDENGIYKNYILGKNTSLLFGTIFFVAILIFSYPLSVLQGNINAFYGYLAIAIGFIFASLLGAYRGYYQGYSDMKPTAISQVLEQTFKLSFGLLFAYVFLQYGINYGVFGALFGISLSEIFSFVYFILFNKKHIQKRQVTINKGDYKNFIKQVAPVSLSYVILPLSSLIDSFLVVNLLVATGFVTPFATSLYGIETGMILPLINMPNVLVSALALASLPEISYKSSKGNDVKKQVSLMFKIVFMFILPCAVGLFILARPIVALIFPTLDLNLLDIAVNLLRFSAFEMFFLSFVTISNSLLQALGKIKLPAISLSIGIVIKIIFTIIFVLNKSLNIYGLVLASSLCYFISATINVYYIKKLTNFRLKLIEILAPIFASSIMTIVILILNMYFNFLKNFLGLCLIILFAVLTYFMSLMLLKQINFKEIKKSLQTKRG